MKRFLVITLVCLAWLGSLAEEARLSEIRRHLDEAGQYLARGNVEEYEQTLQRAWLSEGDVDDRVAAGAALARAYCRIHHDPVRAKQVLAAAWILGAKPALPLIELADLETFQGDFAAACDAARAALPLSTTARERREARTRFGQAVYQEILQETLRSVYAGTTPETNDRIREGVELLQPLIRDEPGWLEPSRCQVLLALLDGNGPAALLAWQSYFLLLPDHPPVPRAEPPRDFGDLVRVDGQWTLRPLPYTEPGEVLGQILPTLSTKADDVTRQKVVRALAGSRFFPEAAALALRWKVPQDPAIREIILYGVWTDNLGRLLAEEYRRHALGKSYRKHFRIPYVLDVPVGRTRLEKIIAA